MNKDIRAQEKKCDVLVVGRYFCDLVFSGLPEFPRLGHEVYSRDFHLIPGGVYTPAVALHRLGVQVAWPCQFGSDPFSQFVKEQALSEGLDSALFEDLDHPSLRITTAFSFKNERAFLSYADPMPDYAYDRLIENIHPTWVYITHLVMGDALESIAAASRSVNARIYMDCQAHDHSIDEQIIQEALEKVDIFSPNAAEAKRITGKDELKPVMNDLIQYAPVVIVKDGGEGCHYQDASEVLDVKGIEAEVLDSTGAGDNFNSGFLYGQVRGYSIEHSLRIANICGGLSTQGYGGTSTAPTEPQMLKLL